MLTERQSSILRLAVEHFIRTAEPVSSRSLVRTYKLNLSPATIRNEMADLEEMGFLVQPHASAGRVPTDAGYRRFVSALLESAKAETLTRKDHVDGLVRRYLLAVREAHEAVRCSVDILAQVTELVGVAFAPALEERILKKIQLLVIDDHQVLVTLVTQGNAVEPHLLAVRHPVPQEVLNRISRILNENFAGGSVELLAAGYLEVLREIEAQYRSELRSILDGFFEDAHRTPLSEQLVMTTPTSLLRQPEFHVPGGPTLKMLEPLERREVLASVLDEVCRASDRPIFVGIGQGELEAGLADYSLVTSRYAPSQGAAGTIGIIGPRRMDYEKAIVCVEHIAAALTRLLSGEDESPEVLAPRTERT